MHIEGFVDNREGASEIDKVIVELVENIFVCSNTGVYRTYRNPVHQEKINIKIPKGQ